MTKAYCIVDKLNNKIVDIGIGFKYLMGEKNKRINHIIFDEKTAKRILKQLKQRIIRRQEMVVLPRPTRFKLGKVKIVPTTLEKAEYFRIKDTKNNTYILSTDLERYCYSNKIGKLYSTKAGVERAFSAYTGTLIAKRKTKAQKVLMGTKKACQYEIEPVRIQRI